MTMHILLVENNNTSSTQSALPYIQEQGYGVDVADSLESFVEYAHALWPSLIVLHPTEPQLSLPKFQAMADDTELDIPCIVLNNSSNSITDNQPNQVTIVSKMQDLSEYIHKATETQRDRFVRLPNLVIDCLKRQALRDKKQHTFTPKEFKLLHLLLRNHHQVLTRKEIMEHVWETSYMGDTRTLDVHIRWIRQKIEANPSRPKYLITVRRMGYRFMMNPD